MSIDARIQAVKPNADGTLDLVLAPRDARNGPGQKCITIENPRPAMEHLVGMEIWGGSSELMIGQATFAKRTGYTTARLV